MDKQRVVKFKSILALLTLYFGWGSTYMAIAVALENFPPFILAGIRFSIAGSILFIWCLWKSVKIPPKKDLLHICIAGFLLLFLGTGSVIWVEQYLTTGITSIIWASLPIWLVVLDKKRWKIHLTNYRLLSGLIIGFTGVIVLFWDNELLGIGSSNKLSTFIIAIIGVLCFSLGSLYSKYIHFEGTTIIIVSLQMMFVGVLAMIFGYLFGEQIPAYFNDKTINAFWGLVYLIVVGSLLAYFSYVWLLDVLPTSVVGTYTYVNPAVAILLGWWFLDEHISRQKLIALGIILLGVLIVNFYKSKPNKNDRKNVARSSA